MNTLTNRVNGVVEKIDMVKSIESKLQQTQMMAEDVKKQQDSVVGAVKKCVNQTSLV